MVTGVIVCDEAERKVDKQQHEARQILCAVCRRSRHLRLRAFAYVNHVTVHDNCQQVQLYIY